MEEIDEIQLAANPVLVVRPNSVLGLENIRQRTCKLSFLCYNWLELREAPKVKLIFEAAAVFVVSVVVLFILALLRSGGRATGIGVLQVHGILFMYVGVLYLLAGLLMRFAIRD